MICKNCNKEIPDGSKFCMECGAKQDELKKCHACGTGGLPVEALFCPNCGQRLSEAKEASDPQPAKPVVPDDIRDLFFPIQGVTLGKTTIAEVKRMGIKVEDMFYDGELSFTLKMQEDSITNITFYQEEGKRYVNKLSIHISECYTQKEDLPSKWLQLGITPNMPYNEWLNFFKRYNFMSSEVHYSYGFLANTDHIYASSGKLTFNLLFHKNKSQLGTLDIECI